jgi:Clp amino terminal domain, pathogenicity island component
VRARREVVAQTASGDPEIGRRGAASLRALLEGVEPRLKLAFANALDYADGQPLRDEDILLGMLTVPDSLAAQALGRLGVSLRAAEAIVASRSG